MTSRTSLVGMIFDLWHCLSQRRRRQFWLLLGLMVVASIAEAVSIGAVLPFLGVLTSPERVFTHAEIQPFVRLLEIETPQQLLLPVALGFCAAAIVSGGVRLLLLYTTTRYSYVVGADLSIDAYRRTLYQPYAVHISRNSSEVINGITGKTAMMVGSILVPMLNLFSVFMLLVGILSALLSIDPTIALTAGVFFGGVYWLIIRVSRRRLQINSECIARESTQVIKSLQEGLGGIRDVLVGGTQAAYVSIYQAADRRLRYAQGNNTFIGASPRFVIETLGMVLVVSLAYVISQREGGVTAAIPILGTVALGAQRLLPILQQGYSSLAIIRGAEASLRDTLELLDQTLPEHTNADTVQPIVFASEIRLGGLSFRYAPDAPWVLRDVDLKIKKGQRIGFMGATGSGKSTLLDIVMGLMPAGEGSLEIDGEPISMSNLRAWQAHIAHVPQSIYLADCSVAENIAFGIPRGEIDHERVRMAARRAQIAEVIENLPKQYETFVGERGVRLSGGQRQRIGIARALYKRADVIIFDEATSALDHETERAVMEAIDGLGEDLTVLIVAHRLSTLRNCDLIAELDKGRVRRIGSYRDLITHG